jgi:NodT family efflux transporter outer membrane factor (OMF) lipoprotein
MPCLKPGLEDQSLIRLALKERGSSSVKSKQQGLLDSTTLTESSRIRSFTRMGLLVAVILVSVLSGCRTPREWKQNGYKVGPNYHRPVEPVANAWIDAADPRLRSQSAELASWWTNLNDPVLDQLVQCAYQQNLTIRETAFRVLQARAELGITQGRFFPQQQYVDGGFTEQKFSGANANSAFLPSSSFGNWQYGFGVAWELDFWGKYRRMIEAADAHLDASIEDYDAALVTLIGDVAENYVQLRIVEQQLAYIEANVKLQSETLGIAEARFNGGQATELDVDQATSVLAQTESQIPSLEIQRRQLANRLCILLGVPVQDLDTFVGPGPIPSTRQEVVVGIPADLLRNRPDVRREERKTAMESARIGVAESDLYPAISVTGNLGYSARQFSDTFSGAAFTGAVGPGFRWNVLNYGRLLCNIEREEAAFEAQVASYQQTVLKAGLEAENAIVEFLKSQEQTKKLEESVRAMEKSAQIAMVQYKGGLIDFNRVSLIEQNLVAQQNLLAQAQGNTTLGLVNLYRALGGGWEIRLSQVASNIPASNMGLEGNPDGAAAVESAGDRELNDVAPLSTPDNESRHRDN